MIFPTRSNALVNLRVRFENGSNVAKCALCLWEEPYARSADGRAKFLSHPCSRK